MNPEEKTPIADFVRYNNAVPIVISLILLGGSGAFAATNPEVQQAVYSAESVVQSIDNTYLLRTNIDRYPFRVKITSVTEDSEWYYLSYTLDSIDIVDGVWRDVVKQKVLKVNKALLGEGSLSEYAEVELAQVRANEKRLLEETKEYERKIGESQMKVATAYKGLVGKFISPTTETAPVYVPPPGLIEGNDPLAVDNPVPLTTWDANAPLPEPEPVDDPRPVIEDPTFVPPSTPVPDACPNTEGFQESAGECGTATPDPAPPAEETPPAEPPVETPVPEPAPEPEPEPQPEPEPSEPTPAPTP